MILLKAVALVTRSFSAFVFLIAATPVFALPGEVSGELSIDATVFGAPALYEGQEENYASVAGQPEYRLYWDEDRQKLQFILFGRLDSEDRRRSHADIRELEWSIARARWEFSFGISRVFWGVTESRHLVDIVNQTDLVEAADGEEKLGQPMARLALIPPFGTLHLYVLPYFRERSFPGVKGRSRPPLPVNVDQVEYESRDRMRHVDGAVRWEHSIGFFDYGLSYFGGTARDPKLLAGVDGNGRPFLLPRYELIRRGSLDAQLTLGGWLLKLEGLYEEREYAPAENYFAAVAGFEYTIGGIFESRMDVGVLTEYLFDERGEEAPQPFDDDVFWGARVALNNEADTDFLVGVIVDRHRLTTLLRLEGGHRIGQNWRLAVEASVVDKAPAEDAALYPVRNDDWFSLRMSYFF
ncbi:MAG: hypothetical protein RIF32_22080 [Leptospirales bacterium]